MLEYFKAFGIVGFLAYTKYFFLTSVLLILLAIPSIHQVYTGNFYLVNFRVYEIPTQLEALSIMNIKFSQYMIFKDIAFNEFLICAVFVIALFVTYLQVKSYFFNDTSAHETVEAHSIMVTLPRIDQLTKDKTKLNAMNMTHAQMAEQILSQITMRDIHQHFSSNFGDIHRIYFGRDFNELHQDSVQMVKHIRSEFNQSLNAQ